MHQSIRSTENIPKLLQKVGPYLVLSFLGAAQSLSAQEAIADQTVTFAEVAPIRDELLRLQQDPAYLDSVLAVGAASAREHASQTMAKVRDVMGLAQTGTGKTLAFGLPLLSTLLRMEGKPEAKSMRGLILAPTRELAIQIRQPRALQIPVGQAAIQRVGGVNLHAGHAQINAHLARHPRQEITAADVWEISNGHFRHCQAGAFGDHT